VRGWLPRGRGGGVPCLGRGCGVVCARRVFARCLVRMFLFLRGPGCPRGARWPPRCARAGLRGAQGGGAGAGRGGHCRPSRLSRGRAAGGIGFRGAAVFGRSGRGGARSGGGSARCGPRRAGRAAASGRAGTLR